MKKYSIIILSILITASITYAQLQPFLFTFTGRWQPTEDTLLIDDNGFQDIQNLRKDGKRLKGVSGHTKINTTVWGAEIYPRNGYHFKKDQPSESHVIIDAWDKVDYATDTVLLLHCDGIDTSTLFEDSSKSAHVPETSQQAQIDTAQKKYGTASGLFQGSVFLDLLTIEDSPDWYLGTGEFTIDFWIRFAALPVNSPWVHGIYEQYVDASNRHVLYLLKSGSDYHLVFLYGTNIGGVTGFTFQTSATGIVVNTWYHIAIIRGWGGNTNDFAITLDGSLIGSGTDVDPIPDLAAGFNIGRVYYSGGYRYLNGWIDEFRIVKGDAVWTANFDTNVAAYHPGAYLYDNTTAIPSAGNFSSLYLQEASAGIGRFAPAPQGNMLFANGAESCIWGGNESLPVSFLTSTAIIAGSPTDPRDFSSQVRNTLTTADEVAIIGGGNDSATVLMLHSEGADAGTTFTDSSTTPHTPAAQGNAQTDVGQFKFGKSSGLYDGTGDYLDIPDHADWFMSTGAFTIEFWVRFNTATPSGGFFNQRDDDDNEVNFWIASGTTLNFQIDAAASNTINLSAAMSGLEANRWYHIALIRGWSASANLWVITLDGTRISNILSDADPWPDLGASFLVGRAEYGAGPTTTDLNGWIDEFRVTKGVARWTENFTPNIRPYPTSSYYWLVGYYRPLQGVKYTIVDANTQTSVMTVSEWNGSSWQSLTITDNTDSGPSLGQTGTVTWTASNEARTKIIEGLLLYWYQFYVDVGDATISTVTVDAPFQSIKNIWDGTKIPVMSFNVYDGGIWEDYTDQVNTPSTQQYSTDEFAAELDDLTNTEYVYVGFTQQATAIKIGMTVHSNVNAATITVYYWDGEAWVSVGTVSDETLVGGNSLSASDYISWNPPGLDEEYTQSLFAVNTATDVSRGAIVQALMGLKTGGKGIVRFSGVQVYYYKLMWSATLSADVLIDTVEGVPSQKAITGYDFPGYFKNRSWLFGENSGAKNVAIYSAFNAPDIWNGPDSGYIFFGDDEKLTAYAVIFNSAETASIRQMFVTKANETYIVTGSGPESWNVQKISNTVGCIAPLSMTVTDRNIAIWQSSFGVVMSDGTIIISISEDIRAYWDVNDSRYIPADRQDDSVGFYDSNLKVYKLLISSGPGQATHNIELEYSLKSQEWTKIYRENSSGANPLQIGLQVEATDGNFYTYGATDEGTMYRLENGKLWDTEPIDQYVQTKDLILGSLMNHSNINYLRVVLEKKSTGNGEDIDIIHYCDKSTTATVDGTLDQSVPADIDMADGYIYTTDCFLGECISHSIKFSVSNSTVYDGMELGIMGIYYDTIDQIIVPE